MSFLPIDYFTSSGKYPDRAGSREITNSVNQNAKEFLYRVNNLLKDLKLTARFSSGFRTTRSNSTLSNAAKKSKHTTGQAGDLEGQAVGKMLLKFPEFLEEHDLCMEHPDCTPTWTHLQSVPPKSGKRIFRCGICKKCKK